MPADLDQLSQALRRQWGLIHTWIEPLGSDLFGMADSPSALPQWSNRDLVAHLGRAMQALTVCTPSPTGTNPLKLAEYLGLAQHAAPAITDITQALAQDLGEDLIPGVDRLARESFAQLDLLIAEAGKIPGVSDAADLVVQARRAPVTLRTMVVSRLIELVVHADDLVHSLDHVVDARGSANPIDPESLALVADELLSIVITRGGWSLTVADPQLWVRLAAGRTPYDVDDLALALEPEYTSEGVPDLGLMMPLL